MTTTKFKLIYLLYLFFLLGASMPNTLEAQPPMMKERLNTIKIGFYSEKLQLTPEESMNFWPVHNAFMNRMDSLRQTIQPGTEKLSIDMSDEEATRFIANYQKIRSDLVAIEADYFAKMLEILPAQKVAILTQLEKSFQKRILSMIQKREEMIKHGANQNW